VVKVVMRWLSMGAWLRSNRGTCSERKEHGPVAKARDEELKQENVTVKQFLIRRNFSDDV
jgi:hypothetical protein